MRLLSSKSAFHHNLYKIYPPEKYRVSHDEWYPVHNGIRYPEIENPKAGNRWQPVLNADGLLEEGVKNVSIYLDNHPEKTWFSLGMNDSLIWGDSQLQGKPKNSLGFVDMSDYYISWANKLVKEVLNKHPNKKFGFLAYHNVVDAPSIEMHSSLVPFITYDRMQWVDIKRERNDKNRTI